jgi:hypothetical protein
MAEAMMKAMKAMMKGERMGGYLPHARVGIFPHPQGHDYRCYQSAIVRTALCYPVQHAGGGNVAASVEHTIDDGDT